MVLGTGALMVTTGLDPRTCWFCNKRKEREYGKKEMLHFVEGYGCVHPICISESRANMVWRKEMESQDAKNFLIGLGIGLQYYEVAMGRLHRRREY